MNKITAPVGITDDNYKITAEYHDIGFHKIIIKVEISFSMIITANKLIIQESKICLFSTLLSLHCGMEPGCQYLGSGKQSFTSCTVCHV